MPTPQRRAARAPAARLLAALLLAACGGGGDAGTDPTAPGPAPGIRILSGANATDTVGAHLGEPLSLQVVRADGSAAAGVPVVFEAPRGVVSPYCDACYAWPTVQASPLVAGGALTTDRDGRLRVRITLGSAAGSGKLAIKIPSLSYTDTARYTIRPGNGVRVVLESRDTVLYQGEEFVPPSAFVDRYGNPHPDRPTYRTTRVTAGSPLEVSADAVRTSSYGLHTVSVTYSATQSAAMNVTVVPRGRLAVVTTYRGGTIGVMDLDGSDLRLLPTGGSVNGMTWDPAGTHLIASVNFDATPRRLHRVGMDGAVAPLFPNGERPEEWLPTVSADGTWMYFLGHEERDGFRMLWRARRDADAAEAVGEIPISDGSIASMAVAPDGGRVAFSEYGPDRLWELAIFDVTTGRLTHTGQPANSASWSPDGRWIAIKKGSVPGLMTADGIFERWFTTETGDFFRYFDDSPLSWSPDGEWFVIRGDDVYLDLVQAETGLRIRLPFSAHYTQAAWAP